MNSQQIKKIVQAIVLVNSISIIAMTAAILYFVSFIATVAILAQGFLCHRCSLLHNWLKASLALGEVQQEYCTWIDSGRDHQLSRRRFH